MWSAEAPRKSRREASLSRDRKRKRDGKEEKREKEEKRDEKRDKKDHKDSKRDSHYDRDHKKSGDYVHKGYGDDRRNKDQGTPRGRDSDRDRAANKSDGRENKSDERREKEPLLKGKEEKVEEPIAPIEETQVKTEETAAKKDWREEMAGEEDERDLSDDEDALAAKMAASRKRREQMMAKAREVAKEKEEEPAIAPKSPEAADGGGSGSDAGAVERKEGEGVSKEQKAEVTKFIMQEKAAKEKKDQPQGDMFGETADKQLNKLTRGTTHSNAIGLTGASGDDWDDPDGYYIAEIGEVMDERYLVVENFSGKGVFSNVVKAKDQAEKGDGVVAIKVMRANDMMKKAAEKEIEILGILNNADKGNKRHVIRMLRTFYYRKHLCLVFESMGDDLRGALKKHTKGKGMSLQAVRAYTKQLIVGLRHMHKCGIIHADIKPDNILISESHNIVKFCDLGTALEIKDAFVSPYLVSRFYRAPEIILGCEYSIPIDVFALGATLCELFTGKILLNSKTNNDSLKKMMELKGKIPKNVIKKGMLWKTHFDDNLDFKHVDVDTYTKETVTRVITDLNAKKDIFDLLLARVGVEKKNSKEKEDQQTIARIKQFADLLNSMLAFDPDKRITANDALSHPFLEDRLGKGVEERREGGDRGSGTPARR